MPDVTVVRHLLANYAPLLAIVPAVRIVIDEAQQGMAMPALVVSHISGNWGQEISAQSKDCTARVQVSVLASSSAQRKQIINLVRAAVPRSRGTIDGVNVDSILRLSDGPHFRDEAGIYIQIQDFMVRYTE